MLPPRPCYLRVGPIRLESFEHDLKLELRTVGAITHGAYRWIGWFAVKLSRLRSNLVSSESQQYLGLGGSSSYQPGSNYETVSELERCLHLSLLSPNRCLNRSK